MTPVTNTQDLVASGSSRESAVRIIQLDDRDPLLVEKMLECLYKGDYQYESLVAVPLHKLSKAPEEMTPASVPGTPSTDDQSSSTEACLTPTSSNEPESNDRPNVVWCRPARFHAAMYTYANCFGIEVLKMKAKEHFYTSFLDQYFSSQFEATVREVYESTPEHDRGLRDIVVYLTMSSLPTLRVMPRRILDDEILKHCPKFTLDLCIALANSHTKPLMSYGSPMSEPSEHSEVGDNGSEVDDTEVCNESEDSEDSEDDE
ncbi:hypothetical protein BBP40_007186 [Aspergillus hancockii]|nr:hypothetical protein BBP40_007186 [Aspergillus hancockii]